SVCGRPPRRGCWPPPDAAPPRRYLAEVFAQSLDLLDQLSPNPGDAELYFFRLVSLHEEMHAEAACYMARALGVEVAVPASAHVPARGEVDVPAQAFRLGYDGPGFAFDNELEAHEVRIDAFKIDAQPVSWTRFLGFVQDGGYEQRHWWDEPGWTWLQQTGRPAHEAQSLPL